MTTSNVFRIDPGAGMVRLGVSGGSSILHTTGVVALVTGLPVAFAGITLLGLGKLNDEPGERTAGYATLITGAALMLVSIPLLVAGHTTVSDARGKQIAHSRPTPLF